MSKSKRHPKGKPQARIEDRLTQAESLRGLDPIEDPYNPLTFDESNWAKHSEMSRREWIAGEYKRYYGTEKPWGLVEARLSRNDWLGKDLEQTFRTSTPWEDDGLTKRQWLDFKPKDRFAEAGRGSSGRMSMSEMSKIQHKALVKRHQGEYTDYVEPKPPPPPGPLDDVTPADLSVLQDAAREAAMPAPKPPADSFLNNPPPMFKHEDDAFIGTRGESLTQAQIDAHEAELVRVKDLIETTAEADQLKHDFQNARSQEVLQSTEMTELKHFAIGDEFADEELAPEEEAEVEAMMEDAEALIDEMPLPNLTRTQERALLEEFEMEEKAPEPMGVGDINDPAPGDLPLGDLSRVNWEAQVPTRTGPSGPGVWDRFKGFLDRRFGSYRANQFNTEYSEPLLGTGTEMMHLSDKPSALEMAGPPEGPQIKAFNGLVESMKEQGFKTADIAAKLGVSVGAKGGFWIEQATLKDWVTKQGKGLLAAPLIAPLMMWINSISPDASDYISLGMSMLDLLTTGDPFAMVLYGAGKLWQEAAAARQKVLDNDEPDKVYGSRYGYVREGDKWLPAVFNKRFKSTGGWANDSEMTMSYGSKVVYFLDGEGNWQPGFADGKTKDFVVQSEDMDRSMVKGRKHQRDSKEAVTNDYFTRDWYFLSPDDAKKVAAGDLPFEGYADDTSKLNPAEFEMNDWRKAMDYGKDWKWGTAVDELGDNANVNTYHGSRGLERILEEDPYGGFRRFQGAWGDFTLGNMTREGVRLRDEDIGRDEYIKQNASDRDFWNKKTRPANEYLMKTVLKDHIDKLRKCQMDAAKSVGFDKVYSGNNNAEWVKYLKEHAPNIVGEDRGFAELYLDTAKDLPTAKTSDELKQQLHDIELYKDRTAVQRNYLAQKVQTRYWMQQIVNSGGATSLMHEIRFDDPDELAAVGHLAWVKRSYAPHPGMQAWQNANEGVLPTLTGALAGTDVNDASLMDESQGAAYMRISDAAVDWTTKYVRDTSGLGNAGGHGLQGGVDPNALIEGGSHIPLSDRSVSTSMSQIPTAYDEAQGKQVLPWEHTEGAVWDPSRTRWLRPPDGTKAPLTGSDKAAEFGTATVVRRGGIVEPKTPTPAPKQEYKSHWDGKRHVVDFNPDWTKPGFTSTDPDYVAWRDRDKPKKKVSWVDETKAAQEAYTNKILSMEASAWEKARAELQARADEYHASTEALKAALHDRAVKWNLHADGFYGSDQELQEARDDLEDSKRKLQGMFETQSASMKQLKKSADSDNQMAKGYWKLHQEESEEIKGMKLAYSFATQNYLEWARKSTYHLQNWVEAQDEKERAYGNELHHAWTQGYDLAEAHDKVNADRRHAAETTAWGTAETELSAAATEQEKMVADLRAQVASLQGQLDEAKKPPAPHKQVYKNTHRPDPVVPHYTAPPKVIVSSHDTSTDGWTPPSDGWTPHPDLSTSVDVTALAWRPMTAATTAAIAVGESTMQHAITMHA